MAFTKFQPQFREFSRQGDNLSAQVARQIRLAPGHQPAKRPVTGAHSGRGLDNFAVGFAVGRRLVEQIKKGSLRFFQRFQPLGTRSRIDVAYDFFYGPRMEFIGPGETLVNL